MDAGFAKLGTYRRVEPAGAWIARSWCPRARTSISLLPAFLAARMVGALDDVGATVLAVEHTGSVVAAVERAYPAAAAGAIGLACAMRAIRRRLRAVRAALLAFITLMADRITGVAPTVHALRGALGTEHVLIAVRCAMEPHLRFLPRPLGFLHRVST